MALPIAALPVVSLIFLRIFGSPGILIVAAILAGLIVVAYSEPLGLTIGLPEVSMGLFAVALAIGAAHGGGPGKLMVIFHSIVPFFLAWILGRALSRASGNGETLWWTAVAFLIVSAPLGILEATTTSDLIPYPDASLITIGSTDIVRPNGWTATDIDFALSITICVALVLGGSAPPDRNSWVLPIALMGTAAVVLSSFRTGWFVLAAIWIWWLLKHGRRRWILGAAALAVISFGIAALVGAADTAYFQERVSNPENIDARTALFGEAWDVFIDHPIFGVGLNAFQTDPSVVASSLAVDTPHDLWLGVFAELGLAGGLSLIMVAGSTVWTCWLLSRGRSLPTGARGAIWACAVLIPFSLGFQILSVPVSAMLAGLAMGSVRGLYLAQDEVET